MAIPVVFNRVVCASVAERFRNLGPLGAMDLVEEEESFLLSLAPLAPLEERVKVVVPSLSALLGAPPLQNVRDFVPVASAVHVDYLHQA